MSFGTSTSGKPLHIDHWIPPSPINRRWRHELLHAGGIWAWRNRHGEGRGERGYSQGVRQRLYELYGSGPVTHGIAIHKHGVNQTAWLDAKFCLASSGVGWGLRTAAMAMLGCLPLIFQPFVMQPLEDLLPSYPNFSLRVDRLQLASDLPALLAAVGPGQVSAMRVALRAAGQALSWAPGGLAFDYTIAALCFRAIELHGSLKSGGAECAPRGLPLEPRPQLPSWFPPAVVEATVVLRRERAAAMRELRARASMRAAPREVAQFRTPRPEDLTEVAVLAFRNLQPPAGARRGFCGVTSYGRSCRRHRSGAMGLFERPGTELELDTAVAPPRNLQGCIAACRKCRHCRFVSFSATPGFAECSWYASCAQLQDPPLLAPDYVTVAVPS